jgi:murein DD-endopeptidase MepM/ murein hydrolase activator NlpD
VENPTRRSLIVLGGSAAASALLPVGGALAGSGAGGLPVMLMPKHFDFRPGARFATHIKNGIEPGADFYTYGSEALITSMAEGMVTRVIRHPKWDRFDRQFIVYVDHGGEKLGIYAHLKTVRVRRGQWVGRYTVLGTGGARTVYRNGAYSKPHVHLELAMPGFMKVLRPPEPTYRHPGKFIAHTEIIDPSRHGAVKGRLAL